MNIRVRADIEVPLTARAGADVAAHEDLRHAGPCVDIDLADEPVADRIGVAVRIDGEPGRTCDLERLRLEQRLLVRIDDVPADPAVVFDQ